MRLQNRYWILIFFGLIILSSCENDKPNLAVNLEGIPAPSIKILRYEQAMFSLNMDSFNTEIAKLQPQFPLFLNGNLNDSLAVLSLKAFFSDAYMIELNQLVQNKFADIAPLQNKISKAMQYYRYYFDIPQSFSFYSYVSGLDVNNPIKVIDSNIIIGLDLYLGSSAKVYELSGFPKYISNWLTPESILPDVASELYRGMVPEQDLSNQLLDQMIYEGKRLYFVQALMPEIADTLLLHYSAPQMKWCYENEAKLWALMIENQFIFKNDVQIQKKFMDNGPFTTVFAGEAPSRIGHFIGWRIVSKYMANTKLELQELLLQEDTQLILKRSKYKPKR